MSNPLVTVVCLCYNHERFVYDALQSVIEQTYPEIEVIVVDDASTDNSAPRIQQFIDLNPNVQFIQNVVTEGNCRAFNRALKISSGSFIIDFATDDIMLPDRITRQVNLFQQLNDSFGVVFTDAIYIDEFGKFIREHYEYLFRKRLLKKIPQGNVYKDVLSTYFIASPTMMVRKEVFDALHGYDEALSYEDFDFWVRASRKFKFAYLDEVTTKIRRNIISMSSGWYRRGDKQLHSTYLVCKKAFNLNRTESERDALASRLRYEIRQSVFSENRTEAKLFSELLKQLKRHSLLYDLLMILNALRLPLSFLRTAYHKLRYR